MAATRLLHLWESPGKNTGVGCHFLLQSMKVKSESEVTQSCPTLRYPMDCSLPGSSIQGIFHARVLEWGAIAFSQKMLRGTQLITPKLSTKPFAFRIFHSCLLSEDFQMLKPSYVSSLSPLRCWLPDVPEEE